MVFSFIRAIVAFFVFSYIGFLSFGSYQKAEEIELAAKTSVFLGLVSSINLLFVAPPPWRAEKRAMPQYFFTFFLIVSNWIFSLFIVFTGETAFAIVPIAVALNNLATNSKYQKDPLAGMVTAVILATIAAFFMFDNSQNSADIADSIRNLFGFKEVKDTTVGETSYITGPNTVFVNAPLVAILVFAFSSSLMLYKRQIAYPPEAPLSKILDPEKNGIENLARFIGELRR